MFAAYRVEQVRAAEAVLLAATPDGALMQCASVGLAVHCAGLLAQARGKVTGARVVLLVGSGNNGGDALWAGAMLRDRGCVVHAVQLGASLHEAGSRALARAGGHLVPAGDPGVPGLMAKADIVLDGILGIGGRGSLRDQAAVLAEVLDSCDALVVAVDVPSGVDADTGVVDGSAVTADHTVTFGCLKPGLVLGAGRARSGTVAVVDIGLGPELANQGPPAAMVLEGVDVAEFVPAPSGSDYKYSRGVVGVSAGSAAYPGAALLCTGGARHANVGMVRYLDRADGNARTVGERWPDVVIDGSAPALQARATAWACGPGFVGGPDDEPTVLAVLDADVPVVLDAGALLVVASSAAVRAAIADRFARGLPTVLTPHEGEFRAIAPGVFEAAAGRANAAAQAAALLAATVVLKGAGTVIASPCGEILIDVEGTADLGVAGSGDVLSGITGALLAHAWQAGVRDQGALARVVAGGVWIHGRAGVLAAESGPVAATDIVDSVRYAIGDVRAAAEPGRERSDG